MTFFYLLQLKETDIQIVNTKHILVDLTNVRIINLFW